MEPPRKAFKCLRGEAGLDVVADAKEKLCGLSGDEGEVHEGPAAQVEEHYYVRNFVLVMDEVLARYESLLWPKEREMIATWKSLSYPAQQLFVRLYLRKPTWFIVDGLDQRYTEIKDLSRCAIPELIRTKLATSSLSLTQSPVGDCESLKRLLFCVLKTAEPSGIIQRTGIHPFGQELTIGKRKRDSNKLTKLQMAVLIAENYYKSTVVKGNSRKGASRAVSFSPSCGKQKTLLSFFSPQATNRVSTTPSATPIPFESSGFASVRASGSQLPSLVQAALPGDCISLSREAVALFRMMQHLFFLSPWQDQSILVLADMEKVRYPPPAAHLAGISCLERQGIFETRKQFEEYQNALFLEMELSYALQRLRPSIYGEGKSSNSPKSILLIGNDWSSGPESVNDSMIMQYNYQWQCHLDSSPQSTLLRVLHNCALTLFSSAFQLSQDPYRTVSTVPPFLGMQLAAVISVHNSASECPALSKKAAQSTEVHLSNEKENAPNLTLKGEGHVNYAERRRKIKEEPKEHSPMLIKDEAMERPDQSFIRSSENESEAPQRPHWKDQYRSEWIMARTLTHGIAELERQKDFSAASCFYRLLLGCGKWAISRRGHWWERLSLILQTHSRNHSWALSVASLALEDALMPFLCPERISLLKRVQRLYKPPLRWGTPPTFPAFREPPHKGFTGRLVSSSVGHKNKWLPLAAYNSLPPILDLPNEFDSDMALASSQEVAPPPFYAGEETVTVECLALQWYHVQGWEGMHCEGGVVYPLFIMMCYPVIFSNIPEVFQSRFQDAPLDILAWDFYEKRKDSFEALLTVISGETEKELSQRLECCWEEHYGETLRSVEWKRYSLTLLQTLVTCFGGQRLSKLFRIVAQNYKASRSGMPDLLLWKTGQESDSSDILFSEVKGPRDRLSPKQVLWNHRLLEADIPVEVIHVQEDTSDAGQ